jgi:uncharacterized membrane protein HdeD (DUF308 family)
LTLYQDGANLSTKHKERDMGIFSNKLVVAIVCIVAGFLILPFLSLPTIISWIIGIFLIVYGILVLMGKS